MAETLTLQGAAPDLILDKTGVSSEIRHITVDSSERLVVANNDGGDDRRVIDLADAVVVKSGPGSSLTTLKLEDTNTADSAALVFDASADDLALKINGTESASFPAAGGIRLVEKAAAPATGAGEGAFWVMNTANPSPRFRTESRARTVRWSSARPPRPTTPSPASTRRAEASSRTRA